MSIRFDPGLIVFLLCTELFFILQCLRQLPGLGLFGDGFFPPLPRSSPFSTFKIKPKSPDWIALGVIGNAIAGDISDAAANATTTKVALRSFGIEPSCCSLRIAIIFPCNRRVNRQCFACDIQLGVALFCGRRFVFHTCSCPL